MRRLSLTVWALVLLSMSLGLQAQDQAKEQKVEPPKVLALLFHADWCNSCKVLEPKLNQVKRDFQGKPIFFTRFDLTDEFTTDQSARYAALLGLDSYYREHAGKTGFMLLIDVENKKALGKITKQNSPEEIKRALARALAGG